MAYRSFDDAKIVIIIRKTLKKRQFKKVHTFVTNFNIY